jgi:predicted XRE-type DNA-binding protein
MSDTLTQTEAAKILGISHQRVSELLDIGKLQQAPDGRVTKQSVLDRLASSPRIGRPPKIRKPPQ